MQNQTTLHISKNVETLKVKMEQQVISVTFLGVGTKK